MGSTTSLEQGVGSAGPVIAKLGSRMLRAGGVGEEILNALDDAYFQGNFSGARVAQWAGEVGASYLAASLGYNGWAARSSGGGGALMVLSTGGRSATCFRPGYAAAFVPLFVAALVVLCWGVSMLVTRTGEWARTRQLEKAYGGIAPYTGAMSPAGLSEDILLVWRDDPHPRLDVAYDGTPLATGDPESPGLLTHLMEEEKPMQ
ncbi:hypothetical protein H0H81_003425 [Sphagnurus paluster]|uniref:Uncharacterized protein n=1 Tax=Sphagnurus paluster TaxID=117069 RepID=A0A9P7GF92_9AGAR|nr:hypothetical protein H0H81_003425 [Sphagnurus paluster]